MLAASVTRLYEEVGEEERVLEVGGWARPLTRADWVIDLMPYETRAGYGRDGREDHERFSADTWVVRDVCEREAWPFEDGAFDFVVCSHTLEDLRDPVWVCSELQRVAKAGYVELPSRLEEQTHGFEGPWVGWSHHRWLVDLDEDGFTFVFKTSVVERKGSHFPAGFLELLEPADLVESLWWREGFGYRERCFYDHRELDAYLADFVAEQLAARGRPRRLSRSVARARRRAGRPAPPR